MYNPPPDPISGKWPPSVPSPGAVTPLKTALGNDYPTFLRTQQVGLAVVKTVINRIDEALAGGPIRLKDAVLNEQDKVIVRRRLLEVLFPELYGDPIPVDVAAKTRIASHKARLLIGDRL